MEPKKRLGRPKGRGIKHVFLPLAIREDLGTRDLLNDCTALLQEAHPKEKFPSYRVIHNALKGFKGYLERRRGQGVAK